MQKLINLPLKKEARFFFQTKAARIVQTIELSECSLVEYSDGEAERQSDDY